MGSCGDLLVIPVAAAGHINPMIYFLKAVMKRSPGLTVTMLLYEADRAFVASHLNIENALRECFHLELVVDSRSVTDKSSMDLLEEKLHFGRMCEPFLGRVLAEQRAGGRGPKCLIADQFMGWTQTWADKLQIPRYVLISSPATFAYCMYNYSGLMKKDRLLERLHEDPILDLPGIPISRLSYLSTIAFYLPEFIYLNGDTFGQAEGLLLNTFYELERSAIDAFDTQLKTTFGEKSPKLLSVGPLLPSEFFSDNIFKGTTEDDECLQWLNTRPPVSVLYVAFGSLANLSETQIQEVARALEAASEVSFLWVLRLSPSVSADGGDNSKTVPALLPAGFQERTKERGLVYQHFAPQLQIMSHPAIRGFMFHCGWNSSMESVCRGIPMLGWSLISESKTCCRILEQAGVAVPMRPQLTDIADLVTSDEVQKALRSVVAEPGWKRLKSRALEVQKIARAAVLPGGSSAQNLDKFVNDIQNRSAWSPKSNTHV